jgi:DNA-binding NarL/FixJ family response regulator
MKQQADTPWLTQVHARAGGPPRRDGEVVRHITAIRTVVVASTRAVVRDGVRAALEGSGDIIVTGEAASPDETITKIVLLRPDVLMIDWDPAEPEGIDMISQVLRIAPETGVLIYSTIEDDKSISSAIHAGARGYLIKGAGSEPILRGIRAVAAGELIVGRTVAGRMSALLRQAAIKEAYPFPQLTSRERDVLELIAAGRSNRAIARELALAPKTISNRVSTIFGKLGVAHRAQAIVLARDAGLGRCPN